MDNRSDACYIPANIRYVAEQLIRMQSQYPDQCQIRSPMHGNQQLAVFQYPPMAQQQSDIQRADHWPQNQILAQPQLQSHLRECVDQIVGQRVDDQRIFLHPFPNPDIAQSAMTPGQFRPITKDPNQMIIDTDQRQIPGPYWPYLNQQLTPTIGVFPINAFATPADYENRQISMPNSPESINTGLVCVFCKRNGERQSYFTTHTLKDEYGKVICPILRDYTCPNCGATGDYAHTASYCPRKPANAQGCISRMIAHGRLASGKWKPKK